MDSTTSTKNNWRYVSLSELGSVARGKSKHRPRNDSILYGGKYPFVQTSDIKHANFYLNSHSQTYNDVGLAQSKLWSKDTLCMTIAANIAETALLSFPACFPDSVVGFIADPAKSDVRFVKYALDQSKRNFQKTAKGAAQDNLSLEKIDGLKIKAPAISVQKEIASVLSTYDGLIENNEKRIKILEEMARRLYTEWFVKFRFPGHEKTRMVDSGTGFGKIPEGWEVKRLGEIMSFVRGRSYSSEQISDIDGEYYIVNLKSFNRGGGFRFDGEKYYTGPVNVDQFLKQGDVVVAVTDMTNDRAVIARPARVPRIPSQKITFSADVVKMISEKIPSSFIYYSLLDHRFTEATKHKANGANVLHLKPAAILEYRTVIPPVNLLNEFESKCRGILGLIDVCLERNQSLAKTRDLLIPHLVTGKRELTERYE